MGTAHRLALLVDGEEYFEAFTRATAAAKRSILMLGWDFDSRMALRFGPDGQPATLLGDHLNALAAGNRDLRIRILNWDYPMIFGTDREIPPHYGVSWKPHRHIDFRYDDTHPISGSHHQKIVVVDDKVAFVGGFDATNKRWDSREHRPGDPRRTAGDGPYPPFHDTMMCVDGEAATALADVARARWLCATGERLKPAERVHGDPWPGNIDPAMREAHTAVSCTEPPTSDKGLVRQVEQLYLDMIGRARHSIYIENQYFTSQRIADALGARLDEPDGPEIVLVTRLLSHGWLEEATMHVLRTRLVRALATRDKHGRFHALYPHVEGLCDGTCIDLHSKVMLVDDEWARVGSSNLSNRSMGLDTECDLTVEAHGAREAQAAIRAMRVRLLAEHAGCDAQALARELDAGATMAQAIEKLNGVERRLVKLPAPEVAETQMALAAIGDLDKPLAMEAMVRQITGSKPHQRVPGRRVLAGLCLVAIALALAWTFTPLKDLVTVGQAHEWADSMGEIPWAPLIFIALYPLAAFLMFPRWLITLAAVFAFGPWKAFAYGLAGMVLAAVATYLPGRLLPRDTVRRLAGPRLSRLTSILQRRGLIAVIVVRLVPVAPFAVVNIVMGAMRIRVVDFTIGSAIGVLPGMLAATVLSGQLSNALADPADINGWLIGGACLTLGTLAYFGQRWLRRLERPQAAA